jgi:hypothetical protein
LSISATTWGGGEQPFFARGDSNFERRRAATGKGDGIRGAVPGVWTWYPGPTCHAVRRTERGEENDGPGGSRARPPAGFPRVGLRERLWGLSRDMGPRCLVSEKMAHTSGSR